MADPSQNQIDEACQLYAAGKISRRPAARMAGLTRSEFDHELYLKKISSYTVEMLEEDRATLGKMRQEKQT